MFAGLSRKKILQEESKQNNCVAHKNVIFSSDHLHTYVHEQAFLESAKMFLMLSKCFNVWGEHNSVRMKCTGLPLNGKNLLPRRSEFFCV